MMDRIGLMYLATLLALVIMLAVVMIGGLLIWAIVALNEAGRGWLTLIPGSLLIWYLIARALYRSMRGRL